MSVTVGVGQLRQNLSAYLRRVQEGERLVVTDRNRPVAVLGPLPERQTVLERLVAEGRASGPTGDLLDLEPAKVEGAGPRPLSDALEETRAERLP